MPIPFSAGERTFRAHGAHHLELIGAALQYGSALQGQSVAAFEQALAQTCGRAHAVAVGSGTDALFFALVAAGVRPGDEVLVPAVSFIASASCILRARAVPVWVDVDEFGLIDLDEAQRAVTARTRAIIAVDLYGQMVDPAGAEALAAERGIALVEDAAQAPGARMTTPGGTDRIAGATGNLACCSFDPTKTIAAPGSGGAVLCDDPALAEHVRRLRWHGRDSTGEHSELGYNSQLPSAAAAVLTDKLTLNAGWTTRRQAVASAYDNALSGGPHAPVGIAPGRTHVYSKYVLRAAGRDELNVRLQAAGVPTRIHYPRPLYAHPVLRETASTAHCPRAEADCLRVLSLPIHAFLDDDEVARVAEVLQAG